MNRTHYLDKLRGARELLASPDANAASLSLALIKAHSTLEDYLREAVDLASRRRGAGTSLAGDTAVQWKELAALAEQHGVLSARERQAALAANRVRVGIAHGDEVAVDRAYVETYCRFVEAIVERGQSAPGAASAQRPVPPPQAAPPRSAAMPAPEPAPARPAPAPRAPGPAPAEASAPRAAARRTAAQAAARRPQPPAGLVGVALAVLLVLLLLFAFASLARRPAPPPEDVITPGPLPTLMQGG